MKRPKTLLRNFKTMVKKRLQRKLAPMQSEYILKHLYLGRFIAYSLQGESSSSIKGGSGLFRRFRVCKSCHPTCYPRVRGRIRAFRRTCLSTLCSEPAAIEFPGLFPLNAKISTVLRRLRTLIPSWPNSWTPNYRLRWVPAHVKSSSSDYG